MPDKGPSISVVMNKLDTEPFIVPSETVDFVNFNIGNNIGWVKKAYVKRRIECMDNKEIKWQSLYYLIAYKYLNENKELLDWKYIFANNKYQIQIREKELNNRLGISVFEKWKEKEINPLLKTKTVDELLDILFSSTDAKLKLNDEMVWFIYNCRKLK